MVHGNTRFSADLDFDNFNLSPKDFDGISSIIANNLKKEGYQTEVRNVMRGAFHCYIRFPELLYKEGLSGHKEEKILIQLDTGSQHFDFEPKRHILNKFDVFTEILTTPEDILPEQKFYAIPNRPRPKGGDFFDIIFLLGKTKPNYDYLKLKLNINSPQAIKSVILEQCSKIGMTEMARDVASFVLTRKTRYG